MKPFLAIAVSMVASIPVGLCADTPIQLPSGDTVKDSFFEVHPNWYGMFPEETPAFVEKYPSGNTRHPRPEERKARWLVGHVVRRRALKYFGE